MHRERYAKTAAREVRMRRFYRHGMQRLVIERGEHRGTCKARVLPPVSLPSYLICVVPGARFGSVSFAALWRSLVYTSLPSPKSS